MKLYFYNTYSEVRNITLEKNVTDNSTESIDYVTGPIDPWVLHWPILTIIVFIGLYGYKIYKKQTHQFTHFLPFHVLSYCSIITTVILSFRMVFSRRIYVFDYIFTMFYFSFLMCQCFLVLGFSTVQMTLELFGIEITRRKKYLILGIPLAMMMKIASFFTKIYLEVYHLKIEFEVLESFCILFSFALLLGFLIKFRMNKLNITQKLVSTTFHGYLIVSLTIIMKVGIVFYKIANNPRESQVTTIEYIIYSWYFPFLWIVSVYVCYSKYVLAWVEAHQKKEEVIQMTPVETVEANRRRASIETTVSYLSVADISVNG
ncbi:hypothetical protein CAEBREN_03135 [Caenorhabditis brenneri]|uniref:Uncharacterized protein n=1 Tax=Caenorhabditis brenneri TaxID=135651 RepID=G0MJ76_CAEBE|nr:hypothetical protein CAEBREN_03135 [Caenorhabditis brenneri]